MYNLRQARASVKKKKKKKRVELQVKAESCNTAML